MTEEEKLKLNKTILRKLKALNKKYEKLIISIPNQKPLING
jgi:hypothetical protein